MPNHITNLVQFVCPKKKFNEIAEFVRTDNSFLGTVDFNKLIPMPESLKIECGSRGEEGFKLYKDFLKWKENQHLKGNQEDALRDYVKQIGADYDVVMLGKQYCENLVNYGATTWYDWSIAHWGTKWNAYDCQEIDHDAMYLQFNTAWSCILPIMKELSKRFPNVSISYSWADEDIGNNVGPVVLLGGKVIEEHIPQGGSKEAYELTAEVMDFDLAEWGFAFDKIRGTYEYMGKNQYVADGSMLSDDER